MHDKKYNKNTKFDSMPTSAQNSRRASQRLNLESTTDYSDIFGNAGEFEAKPIEVAKKRIVEKMPSRNVTKRLTRLSSMASDLSKIGQ